MSSPYSLEVVYQIWSQHNECFEIGEDPDGLGMTELRFKTDDGKISNRMTIPEEALPLVIEALQKRMVKP